MLLLNSQARIATQSRRILYILVFTLVFEGILRKLLLPLSMAIFFLKDILCIAGLLVLKQAKLPFIIASIKSSWYLLFFLFIPILFFTGFKDPILAIFALKQYLLYAIVGILLILAFPIYKEQYFRKFIFFTAILIIPTTIVALLQNSLPSSHWLNTSIGGESLEAFSAAGYQRVGSTFSFTAQYSWFLHAESFFLAASFFLPPDFDSKTRDRIKPFIYTALLLMLAVSAFVTGGRTAVLGCSGTFALGMLLIGLKRPSWVLSKGLVIVAISLAGLSVLRAVKPQFFMAYDERSADEGGVSHNAKMASRVFGGFTEWTSWFWEQDSISILIGNGLGIMSNGANQISSYAAQIRDTGFWTEGDMSTTFWEGGIYLGVIWYGFRLFCILLCYRSWYAIQDKNIASAAAVPLAYVIIQGLVAQLGMQPPLSIWWWLAIGIILFLSRLERYIHILSLFSNVSNMKKSIIFINSHPIQYFAPMYKRMNEQGVDTGCWYCSDISIKGGFDQEFGTAIKWDIPLLAGYAYEFFKNYSWKPSHEKGFFGLINLGMIRKIFKIPKSVIVVHGWHYFTLFWIILLGKLRGHTICIRCELPYNQEVLKNGWIQKIKNIGLKYILFPRADYFLYIGEQNKFFYKSFNISDNQLLFCPYSVDNVRFKEQYEELSHDSDELRRKFGIPVQARTIIFSAKYIEKKRPLDILRAFAQLNDPNLWLVMVGEGELRPAMESFIADAKLQNIILTGFVNQSKISEYYAVGDLFVMCSGLGETWGLSVNEAMNFNLPLILSDLSGCANDLVRNGINGYTFKTGDVDDLALKLKQVLLDDKLTHAVSSTTIVQEYSYDTVAKNLAMLVNV